jgi:hypothetical protein
MTIPAYKLLKILDPERSYPLVSIGNTLEKYVNYVEAVRLAGDGLVEGVGPHGKVARLRRLGEAVADVRATVVADARTWCEPAYTITARTNIGVYREAVGTPEVFGHVWAHCALRGKA